jgi:hypothetical protein
MLTLVAFSIEWFKPREVWHEQWPEVNMTSMLEKFPHGSSARQSAYDV